MIQLWDLLQNKVQQNKKIYQIPITLLLH